MSVLKTLQRIQGQMETIQVLSKKNQYEYDSYRVKTLINNSTSRQVPWNCLEQVDMLVTDTKAMSEMLTKLEDKVSDVYYEKTASLSDKIQLNNQFVRAQLLAQRIEENVTHLRDNLKDCDVREIAEFDLIFEKELSNIDHFTRGNDTAIDDMCDFLEEHAPREAPSLGEALNQLGVPDPTKDAINQALHDMRFD